jgi:hypothetical protein
MAGIFRSIKLIRNSVGLEQSPTIRTAGFAPVRARFFRVLLAQRDTLGGFVVPAAPF